MKKTCKRCNRDLDDVSQKNKCLCGTNDLSPLPKIGKSIVYNYTDKINETPKTPIYKGCQNEQCFCTGECKEIVGYVEDNVTNK